MEKYESRLKYGGIKVKLNNDNELSKPTSDDENMVIDSSDEKISLKG